MWVPSPSALAVAMWLMRAAARQPAVSEPLKSQFLQPTAMGRVAFSMRFSSNRQAQQLQHGMWLSDRKMDTLLTYVLGKLDRNASIHRSWPLKDFP
jgi:hypothetical protein